MAGANNNEVRRFPQMKTRVDALTTFPRPTKAANDDFAPVASAKVAAGWNAYEVWRTRIKAPQERTDRPTRHG
jgi:hypothetical protein